MTTTMDSMAKMWFQMMIVFCILTLIGIIGLCLLLIRYCRNARRKIVNFAETKGGSSGTSGTSGATRTADTNVDNNIIINNNNNNHINNSYSYRVGVIESCDHHSRQFSRWQASKASKCSIKNHRRGGDRNKTMEQNKIQNEKIAAIFLGAASGEIKEQKRTKKLKQLQPKINQKCSKEAQTKEWTRVDHQSERLRRKQQLQQQQKQQLQQQQKQHLQQQQKLAENEQQDTKKFDQPIAAITKTIITASCENDWNEESKNQNQNFYQKKTQSINFTSSNQRKHLKHNWPQRNKMPKNEIAKVMQSGGGEENNEMINTFTFFAKFLKSIRSVKSVSQYIDKDERSPVSPTTSAPDSAKKVAKRSDEKMEAKCANNNNNNHNHKHKQKKVSPRAPRAPKRRSTPKQTKINF